ncbi:MAG TPA: hypothetical protein VEI07_24605, partial [Planctomycetaceae bacterium]|nr:hypothetical protein [Planctomycetaceae bacterium]
GSLTADCVDPPIARSRASPVCCPRGPSDGKPPVPNVDGTVMIQSIRQRRAIRGKSAARSKHRFLTAENEMAEAYEIDGTPHFKTVHSYSLEHAAIMDFEEQDGKVLYKVKPLKTPAG